MNDNKKISNFLVVKIFSRHLTTVGMSEKYNHCVTFQNSKQLKISVTLYLLSLVS